MRSFARRGEIREGAQRQSGRPTCWAEGACEGSFVRRPGGEWLECKLRGVWWEGGGQQCGNVWTFELEDSGCLSPRAMRSATAHNYMGLRQDLWGSACGCEKVQAREGSREGCGTGIRCSDMRRVDRPKTGRKAVRGGREGALLRARAGTLVGNWARERPTRSCHHAAVCGTRDGGPCIGGSGQHRPGPSAAAACAGAS